jgi:histidinol-phosphate aminotransferase
MQNRRDWFKAALALSASLPLAASLAEQLMAAPVSDAERSFAHPGLLPPAKIRLDANENPYGPPDKAKQAIQQSLIEGNRYTFASLPAFKEVLAKYEGVTSDHILVGAGSAELLCLAGAAFGLEGGRVLSSYPTFSLLMTFAQVFHAAWDKVNLNDKLECDYNALAAQVKEDTRVVFVCNPNNPTGTFVDNATVQAFCETTCKKVPVYVDEAYLEFLDPAQQQSMVSLVKLGENVIVSRTFSKVYGLAGLRVGYVVGKPELIKRMARYQMGFPVNQTAIAAATAALTDQPFVKLSRDKNAEARKHLTDYLDKKGCFYGKSQSNFVFFDSQGADAPRVLSNLAARGIAIRVWDYNNQQWFRVSIGTLEEMKIFVKAFDEVRSL